MEGIQDIPTNHRKTFDKLFHYKITDQIPTIASVGIFLTYFLVGKQSKFPTNYQLVGI